MAVCERLSKVIRIHPLGTANVRTKLASIHEVPVSIFHTECENCDLLTELV